MRLPDYHRWLDRFQRWDGSPPIPLKATQNSSENSETEFSERNLEDYDRVGDYWSISKSLK